MLYAEGNALRYEIDVTQPVGSRIVNLTYKGAPLNPATQFLVVTNNYRASGGGDFPTGRRQGDIVPQAPDASRDVLISYIKRHPRWTWPPMAGPQLALRQTGWPGRTGGVRIGAGHTGDATAHGVGNVSVHDATPDPVTQLSRYRIDLTQ